MGQLKISFVTSGVTIDSPSTPESQLRVRVEPSFDSPINSESEPAKNERVRVESEPSLDSDPSLDLGLGWARVYRSFQKKLNSTIEIKVKPGPK